MSTVDHGVLSAEEQERRRQAMRGALAKVRLEGLEPDPVFFEYAERYSRGEITLEDAVADFTRRVRSVAAGA